MKENWVKKGLIFKPTGEWAWSRSHAQVPVPDYDAATHTIRIFFSTRDEQGRSLPGFVVVDADEPKRILSVGEKPILELGALGTFDDCGVMPSWIVNHERKKYMYYIGWNVRNTIPYHNAVGLAISEDNGVTWKRFSPGPVMDRNYIEPQYSGTSCVLIENGIWKNWYLSCTEWRVVNGQVEPRYHIKYAESTNGIDWNRKGTVAIDYADEQEAGIVKASVIKENGIYRMWFSYRRFENYRTDAGQSYRIGYAESADGVSWKRLNNEGILDISPGEWDSMMTAYPHVIDIGRKRLLFYNGDGFGRAGFGYAEAVLR